MAEEQKTYHQNEKNLSRRGFVKAIWIALISISLLEISGVVIAFLTSGGRKSSAYKKPALKELGKLEDFQNGSVTAFRSDKLYLVRMDDGGLLALSLQCTHLGCAITWNKDSRQFDCPCHASSFNLGGDVISPPAPRALDMYRLIIEGGMLKADLNKKISRNSFTKSQLIYA